MELHRLCPPLNEAQSGGLANFLRGPRSPVRVTLMGPQSD